jgi:hypothetical protein
MLRHVTELMLPDYCSVMKPFGVICWGHLFHYNVLITRDIVN